MYTIYSHWLPYFLQNESIFLDLSTCSDHCHTHLLRHVYVILVLHLSLKRLGKMSGQSWETMPPRNNKNLFCGPCINKTQAEVCSPVGQSKVLKPQIDTPCSDEKVTPEETTKWDLFAYTPHGCSSSCLLGCSAPSWRTSWDKGKLGKQKSYVSFSVLDWWRQGETCPTVLIWGQFCENKVTSKTCSCYVSMEERKKKADCSLLFLSAACEGGRVEGKKIEDLSLFCFYILTIETISDMAERWHFLPSQEHLAMSV